MFKYELTQHTDLRLVEPRHTAEIYAAVERNRAHLRQWLSWVDGVSGIDGITMPRRNLHDLAEHGHFTVGIWQHGQLVGMLAVHAIDARNRATSLGYWLDAQAQGQGIMTRACRALLDHLFGALQLHRVEIRAAAGNQRSQAVARRLGFRHDGTLRQSEWLTGGPVDQMIFSLLCDEWHDTGAHLAFAHPLTGEAELCLLLPHYAEAIFALVERNRRHLQYLGWIDGTRSSNDIGSYIRHALQRMADGSEVHWGIWCGGDFAGIIGTHPIQWRDRRAEFGYWLGEEFQGKGLATAAGRAMAEYCFSVLNLNRLELRIRTDNPRSRAVADRLGFTQEGILRQAVQSTGKMVDYACYGLLRAEWETPAGAVENGQGAGAVLES